MTFTEYVPVRDRVVQVLAEASNPQTVQQLAETTAASLITVHRHLRALEQRGHAHRHRGGWTQQGRRPDQWTRS